MRLMLVSLRRPRGGIAGCCAAREARGVLSGEYLVG